MKKTYLVTRRVFQGYTPETQQLISIDTIHITGDKFINHHLFPDTAVEVLHYLASNYTREFNRLPRWSEKYHGFSIDTGKDDKWYEVFITPVTSIEDSGEYYLSVGEMISLYDNLWEIEETEETDTDNTEVSDDE